MSAETPAIHPVGEAFSKKAAEYDSLSSSNLVLKWMRDEIRSEVISNLKVGSTILELNAGSGVDAIYFGRKGYFVMATDISTGMLNSIKQKIIINELEQNIHTGQLDIENSEKMPVQKYDCVFSNLGGFNCIENIDKVLSSLREYLNPGGIAVITIMPRISPWELAAILKADFKLAFRRYRSYPVNADIEGRFVKTWYHPARKTLKALRSDFRIIKLKSLCFFVPPSYKEKLIRYSPGLVRFLMNTESLISAIWPFNRMGDFYVVTAGLKPGL